MTSGVVIVVWNGEQYLEACLDSVLKQTRRPTQLVLVDNASSDRSMAVVHSMATAAKDAQVVLTTLHDTRNTGFTCGANRGLRALLDSSDQEYAAILLNQDATLDPTWCEAVTRVLETNDRAAAVGSKILMPNRLTIQHAGGYLERPRQVGRHFGHYETELHSDFTIVREVEFVTAAAMAIRTTALRSIGLFNEVFTPGYYEDVDWCQRAREAGWKIVYSPDAVATHFESASFSQSSNRLSLSHRNRLIFALPLMVDPTFRADFWRAERQWFETLASVDERRALASAYLFLLLMLREASVSRIQAPFLTPALVLELIEGYAGLRRDLTEPGGHRL